MSNSTDLPSRKVAVIYRRAAQILQARGHSKGWFVQPSDEVCMVGALLAAQNIDPRCVPDGGLLDWSQAMSFLSGRLWVAIDDPDPVERIAEWNDQPERTQAEVVEAFLDAARAIESREAGALVPTSVLLSSEVAAA